MLALVYLALAICLGERLCRRFYRFVSVPHRWAAAVLVGLLVSWWFTYLVGLAFAHTAKPLLWSNVLFFATASGAVFWLSRRSTQVCMIESRAQGSPLWDWLLLAIYFSAACWLMFATLNFKHGNLQIARNAYGDIGPNLAIAQSFAVGHNFPTQYPLFAGEQMRYHFLFYFGAGDLTFLGLNPGWSLNILSILSMVCMLALVMALGQLLFGSRVVGRIGSALFFFSGSLSFITFFHSQSSLPSAIRAVFKMKGFLTSGYPYAGEDWGIWTPNAFTNQRHLAGAIGILVITLIFLIDRYRQRVPAKHLQVSETLRSEVRTATASPSTKFGTDFENFVLEGKSFIFSGFVLGALPFWNPPVFVAAFAVLLLLFFFSLSQIHGYAGPNCGGGRSTTTLVFTFRERSSKGLFTFSLGLRSR